MIDFQLSSSIEGYQYDCTWLIKKQPEFDKVYMKIIKFRTDTLRMYPSDLFFFFKLVVLLANSYLIEIKDNLAVWFVLSKQPL